MGLPSTAPRPDLNQPGFDQLAREIQDLKRRVSALEARTGVEIDGPEPEPRPTLPALKIEAPAGAVVLLGKALLGLAGAYLLRALTDAAILPRGLGLAAGLAYAGVWLYLAARSLPGRKFAAALDACTAAAIVGPLLWEATLRFHAISSWAAATVLTAFTILGLALSWTKQSTLVARIAVSAAAVVAITLLVASRDLLPFTVALLALAALVEFAACRDFRITERWLVAALADLAVILFAYILTRKDGVPEGYVAVTSQAALALEGALVFIYSASAVVVTVRRTAAVTFPEIAQVAAAILAGFFGAMMVGTANTAVGIIALVAGICCYAASFQFQRDRSHFAYSTFGFVLLTTGVCISLSGLALVAACSIFAVASCSRCLYLHSSAYLLIASGLSGVAMESVRELFGSSAAGYGISYGIVIAAALACYAVITRGPAGIESRIAAPMVAGNLAWLIAGATAHIIVRLAPLAAPASRTAVLMALSIVLAWAGVQRKRAELVWLVYAFMALGAYKLLTQDFPQEHRMPLVVSLLLYGSTLMALPRLLRPSALGTASGESGAHAGSKSR